jgi:hypothetical protein
MITIVQELIDRWFAKNVQKTEEEMGKHLDPLLDEARAQLRQGGRTMNQLLIQERDHLPQDSQEMLDLQSQYRILTLKIDIPDG